MPSPAADVPDRVTDSHREASPPRSPPEEADTVALVDQLEGTRITRKGDPYPKVTPSSLKMTAAGRQDASKPAITHPQSCPAIFTDVLKEGWGAHLGEYTARELGPFQNASFI